jgi:hypothetical protein
LYDDSEELAGVNSAYVARAPLVGRRFWIYRRFVAPGASEEAEAALLSAAFDELASEFGGRGDEPVGLCVLVSDRALIEARREAIWPGVDLTFAGYTDAGVQVRVRYFDGALI